MIPILPMPCGDPYPKPTPVLADATNGSTLRSSSSTSSTPSLPFQNHPGLVPVRLFFNGESAEERLQRSRQIIDVIKDLGFLISKDGEYSKVRACVLRVLGRGP